MRAIKARYVTLCQQFLALGAVVAVLSPAAAVVSLDVVTEMPASTSPRTGAPTLVTQSAAVPTAPTDAVVREVPLAATVARPIAGAGTRIVSPTEHLGDFGTIGLTWAHGTDLSDGDLTVQVRTRTADAWSDWSEVHFDADHGPDPDSAEGKRARPGTDPLVVGRVDDVQVRATTAAGVPAPADLRLSLITPGTQAQTRTERPAIDTGALDALESDGAAAGSASGTTGADAGDGAASADGIALKAGSFTPKPQIFSRAQWGADERLRSGSPRYYEVHAGFVHHTVNANDYTRDEVPGILRSIYAYHTQSRGWSDIGYNFLVDRFGRIWEGRYGGVSRPVVGAHTLGYNDYAFAMSAIGNFDITRPSSVMIDAYARLFAWKLSLHGVDVSSTRQNVGGDTFAAINGHRDAGSTACPGQYLYAQIPAIRRLAATYQKSWQGRRRTTDLASTGYPDLLLRRSSDGAAMMLSTQGLTRFRSARVSDADGWSAMNAVVAVPDLTGDGKTDLFARERATGRATVRAGDGAGHFSAPVASTMQFVGLRQITAVGDLDRDGRKDLVAKDPDSGALLLFRGTGGGTFARSVWQTSWPYDKTVGIGDFDRDGYKDVLGRAADGSLWLVAGRGRSAPAAPVKLAGSFGGYDVLTGNGDHTGDGKPDLVARKAKSQRTFVFPNDGRGGFDHWLGPIATTEGIGSLSSGGNVTDGGLPDLVGVRNDALVVLASPNTRNVAPATRVALPLAQANAVLNVGDWDRDGDGDVVLRMSDGRLRLYPGNGDGTFGTWSQIGSGFGSVGMLTAVGDTTGDGYPDLMGQPSGASMRIYPGRGARGLGESYVAHSAIAAQRQVGVGLFNADGAPDNIFRIDDRLVTYPGNGPGGLTNPVSTGTDLTGYDWVVAVGDMTGTSGRPDLVVRERRTGHLWVLPGKAGGFGPRVFLGSGFGAYNLAG